jgi:hypothetical protein
MIVREHIPKAELSDDQRRKLKLVNDNDLFAAFNQILNQRGIPLAVFNVQFRDAQPVGEEPPDPPPGGCYCCIKLPDGSWQCDCC